MRIAIPLKDGIFSRHFGQSDAFAVYEVSDDTDTAHQPQVHNRGSGGCESLPNWIASLGVNRVLVAGIGGGAIQGLAHEGIEIMPAVDLDQPDDVLAMHLKNPQAGDVAPCSAHGHHHNGHQHRHCKH